MIELNYEIGAEYRYPLHKKRFKLTETNGLVFIFDCGHRVTNNVFMDLINCKTGVQVYKDIQPSLFSESPSTK